jgi:hypothetical protein
MGEIAHPLTNVITGQMVCRAEEICPILAELGVTKGQELVMAIPNSNAIRKGSIDTSEHFIVSLLVSR